MKLNLHNQRQPHPHMDDQARRAIVEGHHLGQYPPEGYEPDYEEEDEDEFNEAEMYGDQFEAGNLHTS